MAELQKTPSAPDAAFIKQHVVSKEGEQAEWQMWPVRASMAEENAMEERYLVLTPLCVYLFHSSVFKKSVLETDVLQLARLEIVPEADNEAVAYFVFDLSLTDTLIARTAAALNGNQRGQRTVSFVVSAHQGLVMDVTAQLLENHSSLSRIDPDAFPVSLSLPPSPEWDVVLPPPSDEPLEFCTLFYLSSYRPHGMVEKRKMVASYLEELCASDDHELDLDVYQCMCSNFNALLDITALAFYLLHDTHFTHLRAEDVRWEDWTLVCLVQLLERNRTLKSLVLVKSGLGQHGSEMLGKCLALGDNFALERLRLCDDAVDLPSLVPSLKSLSALVSLDLSRITAHLRRSLFHQGTAGFQDLFATLPTFLVHLNLSHNFLTPRDCSGLVAWLSRCTHLESLSLCNVGGVDWSAALATMHENPSLMHTLRRLDVAWARGFGREASGALCAVVNKVYALKELVLDGCDLKSPLLVEVVRHIVGNNNLTALCLGLCDMQLGCREWDALSKLLVEPGSQARAGCIAELFLDRNQLGAKGLLAVCVSLQRYPPLRVLSLDQNLLGDEVLSDSDGMQDTEWGEEFLSELCKLISSSELRALSLRGFPGQGHGYLGPAATSRVIDATKTSQSLQSIDLSYNRVGEQGVRAVCSMLHNRPSALQRCCILPDVALELGGWQGLLTAIEKAGSHVVLCDMAGVDELYQNSLVTAHTKKQHEMLGRVLAQIKVKLSLLPEMGAAQWTSHKLLQPELEDFSSFDQHDWSLASEEGDRPRSAKSLSEAAPHPRLGSEKIGRSSSWVASQSGSSSLRVLGTDRGSEASGRSPVSVPHRFRGRTDLPLESPVAGYDDPQRAHSVPNGDELFSNFAMMGGQNKESPYLSDIVADSLMGLQHGPVPSSPHSLASPPSPGAIARAEGVDGGGDAGSDAGGGGGEAKATPARSDRLSVSSQPPPPESPSAPSQRGLAAPPVFLIVPGTTPVRALQPQKPPLGSVRNSTQLEFARLPTGLREQLGEEKAEDIVVWGKQMQMEPRENVLAFRSRKGVPFRRSNGDDAHKRRGTFLNIFDSFTKQDSGEAEDDGAVSHRHGLAPEHVRLLLRVCNKAGTPVSEEDRQALVTALCTLNTQQIASYQARARELLMPYVPSNKFRRRSALGGVPDVTLSKFAVEFHAGTELQPLTEVQYENITLGLRSSGKVNFEIEDEPASNWPEYKFTVHPKRGVLKKGKSQQISISFMAQQRVELKDLVIININGSHRLVVSVKADAEIPVFGVDPYSLELVSMNGVVLPRILDHLRAYLTNHGGLRLRGIFHREPDSMLSYAIRQQINRQHAVSSKATEDTLYAVAHMIKLFFMELPQPLFDPLPLDGLVLGNPEQVNAAFRVLSNQSMSLFVWVLDLLTDVISHSQYNHSNMKGLVEEFAPCLHSTVHTDKVKALLYQQLSRSVSIAANSHRTASINQMANHAQLQARVGHLLPSQSFSSAGRSESDLGKGDKDGGLPPGWRLYYTKTPRRRPFFHNPKLNRTQWEKPVDGGVELPPGWTLHHTKTPRNRVFYHNKSKGITQWQMPTA